MQNVISEISFWIWQPDRVEFKKQKGDTLELICKKCCKTNLYYIDDFKAKESKLAQLIALAIFVIGTPLIIIFLWGFLSGTNYIYSILTFVSVILIPSVVYSLIHKDDKARVRQFNRS